MVVGDNVMPVDMLAIVDPEEMSASYLLVVCLGNLKMTCLLGICICQVEVPDQCLILLWYRRNMLLQRQTAIVIM